MNKVFITGNVTADPTARATPNGITVCTFSVAVNRRKDKEATDFFRVNAWRALGESCQKYLKKGRKVSVVGELQARQYDDKQGKTHMSLDVQADDVEFLSPAKQEDEPVSMDDGWSDLSSADVPF